MSATVRAPRHGVWSGGTGLLVGLLMLALFAVPLWWLALSAFRPSTRTFSPENLIETLLPIGLTASNFEKAFDGSYAANVGYSVLAAAWVVLAGVAVSALAGYGFVRWRSKPLVGATFAIVIVSFLLPFDVVALPLFAVFSSAGLVNTMAGVVIPAIGHGLAIFNVRQFFLAIPEELVEAARLDGAGELRIFWDIYVKLGVPALTGAGIILFTYQWNAYLWPLLVVTDSDKALAPIAISANFGPMTSDYATAFAQVFVLTVIPAVVLFATQRLFQQSIAAVGVKG